MWQIISGSLLLSLVHAAIPNHWLPIVAVGKSERWTMRETLHATALIGAAHIASTVIIGILIGLAAKNSSLLAEATRRLKFEELFSMQLDYQYSRSLRLNQSQGRVFSTIGEYFNRFYNEKLPFELTRAQKRVIKEIRSDLKSGRQMNRLLQGDVGSGKTIVALFSMLIALDNQCQACLMAPTEILANQHYNSICRLTEGLGLRVELLTGSMKPSQKKKIKALLAIGDIDILIGTHALIEDDVVFSQLGLVVIDEQHRFGVKQRAKLWAKNAIPPHILVMTATPIPRTLAMTLYADLECSVIDELRQRLMTN